MAATLEVWQPQVEARDELGVERASFCGLSLGGIVGMWLALNAPGRIDRLVLACTAAHLPPPSRWAERAALEHMDLRDDVPRITAPTLVIAAEHDGATPPAQGEWLASAIPGARFELIARAAHLANVEQPEAFNRLLLEHLRASPPAAR